MSVQIKKLEDLDQKYGFSAILSILVKLLSLVQKVDIAQAVKALNAQATGIVSSLKDQANKAIAVVQKKLDVLIAANGALKDAIDAINKLKSDFGLKDSDMKIIHINPFMNLPLIAGAIGVVLLDYLVGGIVIFTSNQSSQIAGLLMLSAIFAAVFFSMAAPSFAIAKRLRAEIDAANNLIKNARTSSLVMAQAYDKRPEEALPKWLRPSEKKLSHSDGVVFYDGGRWQINRNNTWSWFWLGLGTVFGFFRLIPILIDPSLYDGNALLAQIGLLILALIVNTAIFAMEYKRRNETGLPNDIQEEINILLKKKETVLKTTRDKAQIDALQHQIAKIMKDIQNKLRTAYEQYTADFDDLVTNAAHYESSLSQYKDTYDSNKVNIDAFYEEVSANGGDPGDYQSQIPTPETVQAMYKPTGSSETMRLAETFFIFTITKDEQTV